MKASQTAHETFVAILAAAGAKDAEGVILRVAQLVLPEEG